MAKTREIRRTIVSVKSTAQVTKAMELVSASKMKKAVDNALASRFYAERARDILYKLSEAVTDPLPLLRKVNNGKYLLVVISTDRGLCGGMNSKLFHKVAKYKTEQDQKPKAPQFDFVTVGRKATQFISRTDAKIVASFPAMSNYSKLKDIYPLSKLLVEEFSQGHYEKILIAYTNFKSALTQEAVLRRLLPLSRPALDEIVEGIDPHGKEESSKEEKKTNKLYLFEPSAEELLEALLLRLTEMQIYQAVLESSASEHSARMLAMRNASDNAKEIISDLTLTLNKERQALITQEIAEISAGTAVLAG